MSDAKQAAAAEVEAKLARVRDWLSSSGYGAALFATQPGVAWVTGGLEDRVVRNEEPALVWAVVTETAAFLVTTNIEQPRLVAEHDLTGFELHAVPWYSSGGLAEVVESLAGGLKLAEPPAALRMPDPELAAQHEAACAVEAALINATRPGWNWADALRAGQAGYREAGFDGEWREHVQGGPIGYLSREFDVVPGTPGAAETIMHGSAFAWNPSVRGAKSEDTFIVRRGGLAVPVTNTPDWPVTASGRPAILPT